MALKVYRTPIGFHDAYVAAPNRKAALKAWGSDADLFARGVADVVTDPSLTAEPLARPGEVIRRSRGSVEEQLAALPTDPPRAAKVKVRPDAKPWPRPDRAALDAAEAASARARAAFVERDRALAAEERAVADRRRALRDERVVQERELDEARDAAAAAFEATTERWRAS